jgi:uncharacterized protein (TIGR02246 family)
MTDRVVEVVNAASERWQAFFNAGDAAGCASCYEADAKMVAAPFGTFTGREQIEQFWSQLISDGYADVEYIDRKTEVVDDTAAVISAGWRMNKAHGVITRELWVIQENGDALLREDHFQALG